MEPVSKSSDESDIVQVSHVRPPTLRLLKIEKKGKDVKQVSGEEVTLSKLLTTRQVQILLYIAFYMNISFSVISVPSPNEDQSNIGNRDPQLLETYNDCVNIAYVHSFVYFEKPVFILSYFLVQEGCHDILVQCSG
jgi:hypothetical protein